MSGHIYRLYKTLTEAQIASLDVKLSQCTGYYEIDGDEHEFQLQSAGDTTDNAYTLENTDEWDPQIHGGCIKQQIVLSRPGLKKLFQGPENIALNDAVLGLAALWTIKGSSISGCIQLPLSIKYDGLGIGNDMTFELEFPFEPGSLSGTLEIRYVLYLKEASMGNAAGISSVVGTRFGEICKPLSIYIDGGDSNFPIVNVELKGYPLWWVDVRNLDDPLSDLLTEDYVSIVFNKAHKDYERLMQNKTFNTPLFYEVLASALEQIFTYVYTEYKEEMKAEKFEDGTVAYAMEYIRSIYSIRVDSAEALHFTIRTMVDKLRNGENVTQ